MGVLTSSYTIDKIVDFKESNLDPDKVILWIWHANKIPPHIGISSEGKYFSLKSTGKDVNLPIDQVIQLIQRKSIKTLAVELNIDVNTVDLDTVFDHYSITKSNQVTCLTPIKNVLQMRSPSKLEHLLSELSEMKVIRKFVGFNIDASFQGIPNYSVEDIHSRLETLEHES